MTSTRFTLFHLKSIFMHNTNTQITPEVAAAVGQLVLQSQMGLPLTGVNLNIRKAPDTPHAMSQEEYNALLQMPLWQMTGAQYKSLTETIILNLVLSMKQQPQKNYVYGIDGFARLIGKSKATAQRIKSSGIIDDAVTQSGNTIMIDADLALDLIHKHDAEEKAKKRITSQVQSEV